MFDQSGINREPIAFPDYLGHVATADPPVKALTADRLLPMSRCPGRSSGGSPPIVGSGGHFDQPPINRKSTDNLAVGQPD